jgi:uncharacterized protein with gpF-like domain
VPRERTLPPVRPSHAIEMAYRRRLDRLIEEMHRSVAYWLTAAYRRDPPTLAQDATPAVTLSRAVARLRDRWTRRFATLSRDLARWFGLSQARRSDVALRSALRKGGMSVKFTMTPAMRDVLVATVRENVSLIRSIPQHYFTQIEGYVARSVTVGRDLGQLSDDLQREFGVTKRRAALISRDQNAKASAALTRVRQVDLGITEAIWVHSGAGKEPRPTHLRAGRDKMRFSLIDGWYDPAEKKNILPGELINCRCTARPVIPGLS